MAVQDDINAIVATEASIYSTRAASTPLLNTLINVANALPNSVKGKVSTALTPFVLQYNKLAPLVVNDLHSEVPNLVADYAATLSAPAPTPTTAPAPGTAPTTIPAVGVSGWKTLKVGGGGNITGIQFADDGTCVIRNDTYGAHVWTGNMWRNFLPSLPAADIAVAFGLQNMGVDSIAIAPSNSSRVYLYFNGYIYRSDDAGKTFIRTAFARVIGAPNNNPKGNGQYMVVDPSNPDICFCSTPSNGLWKTTDAGASWSIVGAVGRATLASGHVTAFDRISKAIYSSTYGAGVYFSTDGGVTWKLLNSIGMPNTHSHIICDQIGRVWLTDASGVLHLYSGGKWSLPTVGSSQIRSVAVDPHDANRIFAHEFFDGLHYSTDGGLSWARLSGLPTRVAGANEPGWLATTPENMSVSNIVFDPSNSNKLYCAEGIGVFFTNPATTPDAPLVWQSQNNGIEQLIGTHVLAPPGGSPILISWDRAIFKRDLLDSYPSKQNYNLSSPINRAFHADYCASAPNIIAAIVEGQSGATSAISTDYGETWTPFVSQPTVNGSGGSIAINAQDPSNIICLPSNDKNPVYTLDGGKSWRPISIAGVPLTGETGWGHNWVFNHFACCADRVDPDTFYLYNYGPGGTGTAGGGGSGPAGIYKSTDKGVSWTHAFQGNVVYYGYDFFNSMLKSVPGHSGHLFFCTGDVGNPAHPVVDAYFRRSTDHGVTWTTVSNVLEVRCFGFGAVASGQSYPTVWIVGYVNRVFGVFRSDDNCASWVNMGSYPFDQINTIDTISNIDGDKSIFDKAYIAFYSSGYGYCSSQ